jgi:hypothetical protein
LIGRYPELASLCSIWRFASEAYRHAVQSVHVGDDGGKVDNLPLVKAVPHVGECGV